MIIAAAVLKIIAYIEEQMMIAKNMERFLAFAFCAASAIIMNALAYQFVTPTHLQVALFRAILALTAAGATATLPSFLPFDLPHWLRAILALAVLFTVFFFNPALPIASPAIAVGATGAKTV